MYHVILTYLLSANENHSEDNLVFRFVVSIRDDTVRDIKIT